MYKIILLITSVTHPCRSTRWFCLLYTIVSYVHVYIMIYCPYLMTTSAFFISAILLEVVIIIIIFFVVQPESMKANLTYFSLGLILYNYYEYSFFGTNTLTYDYYHIINLVTLDIMLFFLWKGVSLRAFLSHCKTIPYTTGFITLVIVLYLAYKGDY